MMIDAFSGYPEPKEPRIVSSTLRTIQNRILASKREREFYDGDRINGYGGMKDDGRWAPIAENIIKIYDLKPFDHVLQVGAHKGFLVRDLCKLDILAVGTEPSSYGRRVSPVPLRKAPFTRLPFHDKDFDLVIGASCVYTLNLPDAIKCLKEIQRVGKKAWVTLAAAETPEEVMMLRYWFLIGTTILTQAEWIAVMQHAGYDSDYRFDTVQSLNLRLE